MLNIALEVWSLNLNPHAKHTAFQTYNLLVKKSACGLRVYALWVRLKHLASYTLVKLQYYFFPLAHMLKACMCPVVCNIKME